MEWRQRCRDLMNSIMIEDLQEEEEIENLLVAEMVSSNEEIVKKVGGLKLEKARNVERERVAGHDCMFKDYFAPESKRDASGLFGLSTIQKTTAANRMLAYGISVDATDEYCRMAESTTQEALKRYCTVVLEVFGPEYLRFPTTTEVEKQLAINKEIGFPDMFGLLDCMSWAWKNCPKAWAGQFQGKNGHRNIVLEAVADQSLRIWHAYFGLPGSNNDINVIDMSPLVYNLLTGGLSATNYQVNGTEYNRLYLLTNGIYPNWSVFVKTIHEPQGEKKCHFAKMQEALQKDVERCFGVLQARFAIVSNPCHYWDQQQIKEIMLTCIVLHNMVVKNEKDDPSLNNEFLFEEANLPYLHRGRTFADLRAETIKIEDNRAHHQLQSDLIDHLWAMKGLQ